ncbi:MAG TPA: GAF domain-containing sensor histidine kinase, partial [Solirubrobacteraceae bacterium]
MIDRATAALEAMSDAVLAIASERSVEGVLQRIVEAARELAGARYAAIGIPDGEGNFEQFITTGMSRELVAAMGPLPRTHGMLGAMLDGTGSHRTDDIRRDPRFRGWWPRAHPDMASFLGVPIVSRGGVLGAFYLTEKIGAGEFSEGDQRLIEMLAAHAAVAIENARLYERSRELSAIEERNRLARDLHDSVVQKLFGVVLAAQSAATLLDRSAPEARTEVGRLQELAQDAVTELRSLVFQLRPAAIESDGLAAALAKHVEVLRRVHRRDIALDVEGPARLRPGVDEEVFKIAQEALHNALRHARAEHLEVRLVEDGEAVDLCVHDDGVGFDPTAPGGRSHSLGLTSMEERAAALGGRLTIASAPGRGTTITVEVG